MHSKPLVQLALRILKALDVPAAQVTAELIKNREWDKLATQKFDPLQYHHLSVAEFRKTALAMEFLRKGDFLDTTINRAQQARDGFGTNGQDNLSLPGLNSGRSHRKGVNKAGTGGA